MQRLLKIIFILITGVFSIASYASATQWQRLAPGLEYTRINSALGLPTGYMHIFRIDLKRYQLALASAQNQHANISNIANLVQINHATLGVNGGFFSTDFKPLGLRINAGRLQNPLRPISWWGVFFIKNKQAYIIGTNDFHPDANINFAIQSGPRLIVAGKIPNLMPSIANRTALGITRSGKVIILATQNLPLTTLQLAQIMQLSTSQGGLDCVDAINLDGGGSTQLYAKINHFMIHVLSSTVVADAVIIKPIKKLPI
jgi:uncharacterized protein YigE (DUF2233 family)